MHDYLVVNPLTKREAARALLTELFANTDRLPIADVMQHATERGISRRTMIRACGDLGVTEVHNGPYGAIWQRKEAAAA